MSLLLAVLLSAAPHKLALPGLNAVNVSAAEAALHSEVLAQHLMNEHLEVVTARAIESTMGLERQKQLLSCSEQNCTVELAGALGVDGLVVGDIGRIEGRWTVTARVIAAADGKTLAAWTGSSTSDVGALLATGARVLAAKLRGEATPVVEAPATKGGLSRWWALAPGAVAVGGAVLGGVFQSGAQQQVERLRTAPTLEVAGQARDAGEGQQNLARASFGVAAVGLAGAVALWVLAGDAPAPVAVTDGRSVYFAVTGRFP